MGPIVNRFIPALTLTLLSCLWPPAPVFGQADEPPIIREVYECRLPAFTELDDFFAVNPALRRHYYAFISRGVFAHPSHVMLDDGLSTAEEYLYMGRFRLFIEDFFKGNRELMQYVHQLAEGIPQSPEQVKLIAFRHKLKEIEKASRRLSDKVDMLLPTEMEIQRNNTHWQRYYSRLARQNDLAILTRILLVKIHKAQLDLCNFFFPDSFTIDVDNMNHQLSPKHQFDEIGIIAKILAARFPKRGLPSRFEYYGH